MTIAGKCEFAWLPRFVETDATFLLTPSPFQVLPFRCFFGTLKPSRRQSRYTRLQFTFHPSRRNKAVIRRYVAGRNQGIDHDCPVGSDIMMEACISFPRP